MLTGNLVRVRYVRDRVIPYYLDVTEARSQLAAERLLELFRAQEGRTRGELEDDLTEAFGGDTSQLVHRGLAKLLEDRCEFEVVSGQPPEKVREVVFRISTKHRRELATLRSSVDDLARFCEASPSRDIVLREAAAELEMTPEAVDQALFADLKSEQRLTRFKDSTPERLLHRYNVALAQAVLLRSTHVRVAIRGEKPARLRQLLRLVKFHRLICEIERTGPESCELDLDGPLSLFTATQKYGLQLALFLPAVLHCRVFELEADLKWGAQRKPKRFTLSYTDGLVSHSADTGTYVPPELEMFIELFRKRVADWDIAEEAESLPLGDSFWVPDFRLTHRATGTVVLLEVLGFWRRASAERHLERLREHATTPFVLAVSDQLHIDDGALEGLPAGIHRFRQMPLPDEVARLATECLAPNRERRF
jgi:predicted nuclease of restriction endonuclease-like RecB superfamily